MKQNIVYFKSINERIATLKLNIDNQAINIINIHAPTSEAAEEEIDKFYEELYATKEELQAANTNINIIMGDFNGKIGKRQRGEENSMGIANYGNRNCRGQLIIDFAIQNQLKIANTYFKKKENRKWTWKSPSGHKNEIDFILTNNLKLITNIEVINNFRFISDHRLVMATLKINKKQTRKELFNKIPRGKIIRNNDTIYKQELKKNFENLYTTNKKTQVQDIYNLLEHGIKEAAKRIPNEKQKDRNNKLTQETKQIISERMKLERIKCKTTAQKIQLAETRKLVKKLIQKDLRTFKETQTSEIMNKNMSTKELNKILYTDTQWIYNIEKNKTKEHDRTKILEIATQFYEDLYSSKRENSTLIEYRNKTKTRYFTTEEIEKSIDEISFEKSPGTDGILNELIKIGKEELLPILHPLFNKILETEQIPSQWKHSEIILLHKKGNRNDISNYRPISLIPSLSKLFTKLIQKRMKNYIEDYQTTEQAGFRKNKSTIHHLHAINQLIERSKEYNIEIFICFIDFQKAFDSLDLECIWKALDHANVEEKLIRITQQLYKNNTANIKTEKPGRAFNINKGVRQGDPLSPDLFNCVLQYIMNQIPGKHGISINGKKLFNLRFADDIALITTSLEELQQLINILEKLTIEAGLKINTTKTKLMTNSDQKNTIRINSEEIEYVSEYIYLGQLISFDNGLEKEINRRINKAWSKYWSLKHIFKGNTEQNIKSRTFDMCVSPTITYGCQTWALTKKLTNRIRICQNKMERSMLNITWKDKINLQELHNKSKISDIIATIKSLKWSWTGHIMRSENNWTKEIIDWIPLDKTRSKGRQRKRWADDIKATAGPTWPRKARNREEWKRLGETFVHRDIQPQN